MLETSAIQIVQAAEMQATAARATDAASAAKEFEAMLFETILREGGLLRAFEAEGGEAQSVLNEWLMPLLARQLADQAQLGLGEMMMKSMSAKTGEG
jgi:hypothetical protein